MSFSVRPMKEQDLEQVLRLAADSAEVPIWTRQDYQNLLDPLLPNNLAAGPFVAETDDHVVGFAVVRWLPGESAAEIENLLVAREHRRQGIATVLIRACTEWAASDRAIAVRLEVRASNFAALALYRRLGFLPAGVRRGYYASPVEDAQLLEVPVRTS